MIHKYVRNEVVGFVLFPATDLVFHSHVGGTVARESGSPNISAGFAYISERGVKCYGRSESMRLNSAPEDSELLAEQLDLPVLKEIPKPKRGVVEPTEVTNG